MKKFLILSIFALSVFSKPHITDTNFVYGIYKVGDKITAPGKEHLGVKDGMVIECFDPQEQGPNFILSDWMQTAFCVVIHNRDWKADLKEGSKSEGDPKDKDKYKSKKKKIDFSELSGEIGDPDLEWKLRSDGVVLIDGTNLKKNILKNTKAGPRAPPLVYYDWNAITIGDSTVGSGGAYATLAAAYADLGNLTGDVTFTLISATTSTTEAPITETLGGFEFRTTSNITLLADPTRTGNLVTVNHNSRAIQIRASGTGTVVIDNLYFKRTAAGASTAFGTLWSSVTSANVTCHYRDNVFNGNSQTGCAISSDQAAGLLYIYNNTIFGNSSHGILINSGDGNANSIYANNNICGCAGNGFLHVNNGGTIINNAVFDCAASFANIGNATGVNNFSDDATGADGNWSTGTGNQINQVAANGFQSTTATDANYLDIIREGIFDGAGVTNDAAIARALCGRGRVVPGPNGTSVGVAEVAFLPSGANRRAWNRPKWRRSWMPWSRKLVERQ